MKKTPGARRLRATLAAAAVLVTAAAAGEAAAATRHPAAKTAKSTPAAACVVRTEDVSFFRDQALGVKLATKLQFDKSLMGERVQTKVSGGVAILSGNVSSPGMVELAGRLAAETSGVRCVQNYLRVGPPLETNPAPNSAD